MEQEASSYKAQNFSIHTIYMYIELTLIKSHNLLLISISFFHIPSNMKSIMQVISTLQNNHTIKQVFNLHTTRKIPTYYILTFNRLRPDDSYIHRLSPKCER